MDWSQILSDVLKAVLVAALPAIMAMVGSLFGYIRAWVEANTKNQWLVIIEREAFEVVAAIGQKTVEPLKAAAADGKLTEAEVKTIKDVAVAELQARLKDIPKHLFPDLIGRIGHAVEAAVPQAKALANPTKSPESK